MNAPRQRRQHVFRASRRVGLTTFGELLLIVSTLTGALWLGTRFMAVVMNVTASSATTFQDSSAHAVYRISLEADGQMLWVYRPKTGVERLNLVTSEVDRVLALSGMELWTLAHSLIPVYCFETEMPRVACGHDSHPSVTRITLSVHWCLLMATLLSVSRSPVA